MYKVISCPFGKKAEVLELEDLKLETLQKLVGGLIEVLPLSENDKILLVCNEEGWLRNMNANRLVCNSDTGEILSVIAGDFLILSEKENEEGELEFSGIEDEDILEKYYYKYYYPQHVLKTNLGEVIGVPYEPDIETKEYNPEIDGCLVEAVDILDDL